MCYDLIYWAKLFQHHTWASIHLADGRLTVRTREVSKPRNSGLDFSNCSEIWVAPRQQRCQDACEISERCEYYNTQSSPFEAAQDLALRRPST